MNKYFILANTNSAILIAKSEKAAIMLFQINNPISEIKNCFKMTNN